MASREPGQQGQGPGQIQNAQQPGMARPSQPPPGPPQPPPGPPQRRQRPQDPASLTLFRTANFFVHAFAPRVRTGLLQRPGGEGGTLLERIRWTSAEKQRLLAAQTRLLPQVDTFDAAQWREISIPVWLEALAVAIVLGVTTVVQALSVFTNPAYTIDEGNYMANAQALLQSKITPYVYNYNHPPLGWLLIAGWTKVTGSITTFGGAINSGRVLMLVLAVAGSLMLYLITSRLSGSRSAALLAMVLYTLSPLSLAYRHEVALENIGTFWLLLSLCLITTGKSKLGTFVLAAVALGIAILSEGLFLLFLPVMLYAVSLYTTQFQRKFSLVVFVYVALAITSAYALLALLNGELLPGAHPSLIGTLIQIWRAPVVSEEFSAAWATWTQTDLLFFIAGIAAMFINILGGTVNRFQLLGALFSVTFWIFLLISRTVYAFTIVPLLPFLALNIALAFNTPLRWFTRKAGFDLVRALLIFVIIGLLIPVRIQGALPLQAKNATQAQRQALLWIRGNISSPNAVIITNSYLYPDLHDSQGLGVKNGEPFLNAQIYFNDALDPDVDAALHGTSNARQAIFLVVDPGMLKDIRDNKQYRLFNEALHHAVLKAEFGSGKDGTQIQIYQVVQEAPSLSSVVLWLQA